MDRTPYACFTGANLPFGKISVQRDNAAVERYCAAAGTSDVVPLYVSGHDSEYSYRCQDGHAAIAAENWTLDKRGFAAKLWALWTEGQRPPSSIRGQRSITTARPAASARAFAA